MTHKTINWNILAPRFLKWRFLKCYLFNKWNQESLCIIHKGTLLYITHEIGKC